MTDDQLRVTRSFRLFTEKPKLVIFNTADDEAETGAVRRRRPAGIARAFRARRAGAGTGADEPGDRAEFEGEMDVAAPTATSWSAPC